MDEIVEIMRLFLITQIIEIVQVRNLQNLCLGEFMISLKSFRLTVLDPLVGKEEEASTYRSNTFHLYETYWMA